MRYVCWFPHNKKEKEIKNFKEEKQIQNAGHCMAVAKQLCQTTC